METKLKPVELMFAIKLQSLIANGTDISTFTKLGFLTDYTSVGAKKLCQKLKDKGIIEMISYMGKGGRTDIKLLVDPMTLINT